ncbi:hypothetical protein M378DRAFT_163075 [Amanita muscaria Koide BX008]|uniref:Uncharacterized protein n=1 Tax=Amanita muscaria (strain Koide BX008) TaxID=946122 RepID=A0A0C2X797_AMAMK|nr:hypothetical protein M378DRAFT_163075 [Amanita muscaria Koide BX008]
MRSPLHLFSKLETTSLNGPRVINSLWANEKVMRQQKKGDRSAQASAEPRNITRMKRSCDNRNIHSTALETPGLPPDRGTLRE